MRELHLGDGFAMPATAVAETFAVLAVRGAGKTNAARVMAEEMFAARIPFVAVDPVGSWRGLRAGRDWRRSSGRRPTTRLVCGVADLESELAAVRAAVPKLERVPVPVLGDVARDELRRLAAATDDLRAAVAAVGERVRAATSSPPVRVSPPPTTAAAVRRKPATNGSTGAAIGAGERRILVAVAQSCDGVTREQLAVLTGYRRSSRDTYLHRLRAAGLANADGFRIVVTPAAVAALGSDFERLPTGDALRRYWHTRLPEGERRVFEIVCDAYPDRVDRAAIDAATGYRRSTRDTYLHRLAARRLIETDRRGLVAASRELFG